MIHLLSVLAGLLLLLSRTKDPTRCVMASVALDLAVASDLLRQRQQGRRAP